MELILPHERGENAMRQVENGIDEGTLNVLRKKAKKNGVCKYNSLKIYNFLLYVKLN